MSSTTAESTTNNIIIDIPEEYLTNGKTLLIEKYFELFIDGYHLSKPARFVKRVHQLCLVDTQQQDLKSVTPTHQLQSDIHDDHLMEITIELPPEYFLQGQTVTITQEDPQVVAANFPYRRRSKSRFIVQCFTN